MMDPMSKKLVGLGIGIGSLAIVVLIMMAVVTGFGYSLRKDTTETYGSITLSANGTLTDFGSTYPYVQTVTGCVNASDAAHTLNEANYTVVTGSGDNGGFILADDGALFSGSTVNCSVNYKASTDATTTAAVFLVAIIIIASFAGVIILAFMGKIIYKLFQD